MTNDPVFGPLLHTLHKSRKIWLNHIDHAFQVLHDMHGRVWQIEYQLLGGEIYPKESYFRRQLEIRWTAAIFEGAIPDMR